MTGRPAIDDIGEPSPISLEFTSHGGLDGFLSALRAHTGIDVTAETRDVDVLVATPVAP